MTNYPEELLKAYARWSANTESERLHKIYHNQATLFLKNKADDAIERGKLTVNLYRAARELGYVKDNTKKEKAAKTKTAKKLVGRPRSLSKSRNDG